MDPDCNRVQNSCWAIGKYMHLWLIHLQVLPILHLSFIFPLLVLQSLCLCSFKYLKEVGMSLNGNGAQPRTAYKLYWPHI